MTWTGRIVAALVVALALWVGMAFANEARTDTGDALVTDLILSIIPLGVLAITAVAYLIGRARRQR